MKSKNLTNILLFISIGIFLFGSGYKLGEYKTNTSSRETNMATILNSDPSALKNKKAQAVDWALFWDAWNELEQKYVDKTKLDPKKMLYGSIKGMIASLDDPYTFFLTPTEQKASKDELGGRFEGIGAQLGPKKDAAGRDRIVIVAPLKNSPAQRAGVKAGDYINKVDGQSTLGWTLNQAVSKIRGEKGTKVTLTLERNGQELNFTLVRDQIHVDSVELKYLPENSNDKVAYIKINQFGESTNAEWQQSADEVAQKWANKEVKGVIVDVRDNPGGFLDSAVYIASEFLDEGKLIVRQESTVTPNRDYYVTRVGKLKNIPMVVLINGGSASASEIFTGAMRDYQKATTMGVKSFGKGSVQEVVDLRNGTGIHVTVAKWLLPKGEWINQKGIMPDIKVEYKPTEGQPYTIETDQQLNRAIEKITTGK